MPVENGQEGSLQDHQVRHQCGPFRREEVEVPAARVGQVAELHAPHRRRQHAQPRGPQDLRREHAADVPEGIYKAYAAKHYKHL